MNNTSWIWIVAGGVLQVPIIQEAKSRGYKVVVSDKNPNAPGCQLADQVIMLDTYDVNGHKMAAETMTKKPIAVLTAGADVGPTVSAIAETLGLVAESYDVAKLCRNKFALRNALQQEHPIYMRIEVEPSTANTLWKSRFKYKDINPYPCVIKPFEHSGSKGMVVVKSPWEWVDALRTAKHASTPYNIVREVIVEEFLHGDEYATDSFVDNGKIYFVNGSKRIFDAKRPGIELGHVNPWTPPQEVLDKIQDVADKVGVTTGPLKVDFINDTRYGWLVMEAATRFSGGFDHMTTSLAATGKDITGAMLDYALGNGIKKGKLRNRLNKFACAYAPTFLPGKVEKWQLPEQDENIVDVIFLSKDEIFPLKNCANRPVFVIATGDSEESAIENAKSYSNKISVIYDNKESVYVIIQ